MSKEEIIAEIDSLTKLNSECRKKINETLNYVRGYIAKNNDEEYQCGFNDGWMLAKTIYNLTCDQLEEIFGVKCGFYDLICTHTPQEALAKLEAYEKSKDEINVGDVVIDLDGNEKVVLFIDFTDKAYIYGRYGITQIKKEYLKKTGKHIDIQQILEQMGE